MSRNNNLSLIMLFLKQELTYQHKKELLGRLWILVQPLFYVIIFMTIFSRLMGAKLAMIYDGNLPDEYSYSVYLISGLLAWQFFANSIQSIAGVYQHKSSLIRKVPVALHWFPLYVPIVELLHYVIGMVFFSIYLLVLGVYPTSHYLWLLPIMATLFLFTYSLGLIFALLTVFVPDVRRLVGLLIQLLFWATPIVYVLFILPDWAKNLVELNPIYWALSNIQFIYLHQPINETYVLRLLGLSLLLSLIAYALVRKLESDVRDMI